MKLQYILALLCLLATSAHAEDMVVHVWDPGCNHTTASNWFTVAPQQLTQKIYVDLSKCTEEQMGSLLFFGNYATKTSGRQLSSRHKVRLYMSALDGYGNVIQESSSDDGSILADVASFNSRGCWLTAQNMNRNKEIRIRLRAQLIQP